MYDRFAELLLCKTILTDGLSNLIVLLRGPLVEGCDPGRRNVGKALLACAEFMPYPSRRRKQTIDQATPSWNYPNAVRADDQAGYCYCRKRTHWRRWRASERKAVHEGENIAESAMRRRKRGTLRSGKGGKGGRVKSRKQAIAIGLSEARKKGAKVPQKKSS